MFYEGKIAAFEAMRPDIEELSPVERRKFADLCRRWADLAEPRRPVSGASRIGPDPTAGVLLELRRGLRSEE
jgi:hypothetical protein